ncbi:hypothetical protein, partial [Desulfofundulus sp.]|uniref:hypothetical protein n=1 Tax=Desulfofundulus sp. TaxID=2282750 RepID=UPI003C75C488
ASSASLQHFSFPTTRASSFLVRVEKDISTHLEDIIPHHGRIFPAYPEDQARLLLQGGQA